LRWLPTTSGEVFFDQLRNSASVARARGTANTDPMVARTVSIENGSTVSPIRITPEAPAASAVRMMVPRLPGSRTRSSATQVSPGAGEIAPSDASFWSKTAITACGLSRRVIAVSTFSLTSKTSPPRATVSAAIFSTCGLPRCALA
jgi:hypothetical protein